MRRPSALALVCLGTASLASPIASAAAPASQAPAPATQAPATQAPAQAAPLTLTIDDLAGPQGPGSPTPKHRQWKVEPGYGWWGPGDGFDDGFGPGWLW